MRLSRSSALAGVPGEGVRVQKGLSPADEDEDEGEGEEGEEEEGEEEAARKHCRIEKRACICAWPHLFAFGSQNSSAARPARAMER